MSTFHLKISTPDGLLFDGEVERVRARMIDGDVCLLAHHADYVSAVGAGEAAIALPDGQVKRAACIGGMLAMINGEANLIATTFEWAEDIDVERANSARERAEKKLGVLGSRSDYEYKLAQVRLKKALARLSASENK